MRASLADNPESYDGVDGLLSVAENNGQAVRAAFVLRDQLYFVKEHSIYSTQDDGVNEPAGWTLSEVSTTVGTPSVDGVDTGEDWAVIADRSGLYIFDGGEPVKISQEIQPLWDTINWQYGYTLWVRVDTREQAHSRRRADRVRHAAESESWRSTTAALHGFGDRRVCFGAEQLHDRAHVLRRPRAQMVALEHHRQFRRAGRAPDGTAQFFSATARATEKSTS